MKLCCRKLAGYFNVAIQLFAFYFPKNIKFRKILEIIGVVSELSKFVTCILSEITTVKRVQRIKEWTSVSQ